MRLGLLGSRVNHTENIVIIDDALGLGLFSSDRLNKARSLDLGLRFENWPLSVLVSRCLTSFWNMIIVVDIAGARQPQSAQVQIEISLPQRNVFEYLYGGLEGWNSKADLLLSIDIPNTIEQLRILARSLLNLEVRVVLKAPHDLQDPLPDPFLLLELLVQLQQSGQRVRNGVSSHSHPKDDALDEVEDVCLSDRYSSKFEDDISELPDEEDGHARQGIVLRVLDTGEEELYHAVLLELGSRLD